MGKDATLTVERIPKSGWRAVLETPRNMSSTIFRERYEVIGYEKHHAEVRARKVAAVLGLELEDSHE